MYDILLFTLVLFSFLFTYILVKLFIPVLFNGGLFCVDQQKKRKPKIASAGGIPVFIGFLTTILIFIIIALFIFKIPAFEYSLILATIFFGTMVGIIDDIRVNKKLKTSIYGNKQYRLGISQHLKPILSFVAFFPLLFLIVNHTHINFPFLGSIYIGLLYPLLFAPLVFIIVTNSPNLLAGTNGLEAGIMFLITFTLGVYFLFNLNFVLALFAFIASSCSFAFLFFNWYPAKILPGDSLTYFSGTIYATLALVGNAELIAGFLFIPLFIEIILKLKGKMKVRSFGNLLKDNTIGKPYRHIYSWTHIFMHYPKKLFNKRLTEKQITFSILVTYALFCVLGLILFI